MYLYLFLRRFQSTCTLLKHFAKYLAPRLLKSVSKLCSAVYCITDAHTVYVNNVVTSFLVINNNNLIMLNYVILTKRSFDHTVYSILGVILTCRSLTK